VSEVVFVGTSDAFGAGGRRQSAIVLRTGSGGALLLDCGATTGSGLDALGIARDEIEAILISHFHGDHFGGIPLLLLAALYEDERKHRIRIAGPRGIERRVRELASAMGHGLEHRRFTFPIEFEEIGPGAVLDLGPVRARAFATHHTPDSHPHGFVLDTAGLRIAYSGDTGWFDGLPRAVAGSHLFISECTYRRARFEYHLNLETLEAHRREFDCGRIVLTHLGAEMVDRRCSFDTADDGSRVQL
jgi:ribonuclease BN (tRNA processing enzyme)